MSAFISASRSAFLALSRQKGLRRWMETSPTAQRLTRRFIAGLKLEDAVGVAEDLHQTGMLCSLDRLGENVSSLAEAGEATDAYADAIQQASALQGTVSAKLTALGLDVSEDVCRKNAGVIVESARANGTRVEFDMEDSSYTDRTLRIVHALQMAYPGAVRAVIQAYLHRSEADIEALCQARIPVRLCKGAYKESPNVSFPDKAAVDANYLKLLRLLFDKGVHPAIATHDEAMIAAATDYVREKAIAVDAFEFQMLYGVRRELQRRIVQDGFRLRLYVPYGDAWYPYFMRRLAERPANVLFLAKSLIQD